MSEQKFPPRVWVFPYINEDNVEYYECDIQPFAKGMDEQYLSLAEHQALLESEKAKTADELRNYQECLKTLNAVSSGKRELEEKALALAEALEFYASEDRWVEKKEFAETDLVGHRHDDATGETIAVPITKGQYLGISWKPRASTQADRGKRAREALAAWKNEEKI